MSQRFAAERVGHTTSTDYSFLAVVMLLIGLGLSTLFSASYYAGSQIFRNPEYFFLRQLIYVAIGIAIAFALSRIPLERIRKAVPALVFGTLFLMLLTFVPGLSLEVLGARRWIHLFGFTFQPSELVKLTLVLYLAHLFAKKQEQIEELTKTIVPAIIISLLFITLVYLQNDFSTAIFVLFLAFSMMFVARVRVAHLAALLVTLVPIAGMLLFAKQHRVARWLAFWNPDRDPLGRGYQIAASQAALAQGGIWGTGFGRGTQKLGALPEVHSDFVFAVVGEEAGFIGIVFVLALFLAFAVKGYMIGFAARDRFGYYVAFGVTTYVLFQGLFNIAVVAGLIPATGIPLPFFSSGGSSVLVTLASCGLLMNLAREARQRETSHP